MSLKTGSWEPCLTLLITFLPSMFCNLGCLRWQWARIWRKSSWDSFVAGRPFHQNNARLHKKCLPPYRPWNAVALPQTICTGEAAGRARLPAERGHSHCFHSSQAAIWALQPLHNLIEFHSESATQSSCNQSTTGVFAISRFSREANLTLCAMEKNLMATLTATEMRSQRKSFGFTFSCDWWHRLLHLSHILVLDLAWSPRVLHVISTAERLQRLGVRHLGKFPK